MSGHTSLTLYVGCFTWPSLFTLGDQPPPRRYTCWALSEAGNGDSGTASKARGGFGLLAHYVDADHDRERGRGDALGCLIPKDRFLEDRE